MNRGDVVVVKILPAKQREEVYSQYMVRHFHKSEIKSFDLIERLISEGKYVCYGIYKEHGEELIGYAYFIKEENKPIILLDFFAVLKAHRSNGIGSRFLKEVRRSFQNEYQAVFAEVENPDYAANEENRVLRKRRIRFYTRNGFRLSNVLSCLTNSEYRIMVLHLQAPLTDDEILDELQKLYQGIYEKDFYANNIHVRIMR